MCVSLRGRNGTGGKRLLIYDELKQTAYSLGAQAESRLVISIGRSLARRRRRNQANVGRDEREGKTDKADLGFRTPRDLLNPLLGL
ncbi:hypothetical protein DY000_02033765 [Brassica cretica]|uniref:Uncharacterized protein n=1 Tax=Brassica cretica TaxID=69181 RepID=A0ABQ7DD23_BRACR|nr:hypothetical protein DY000_02033765 [Brassica cretica]